MADRYLIGNDILAATVDSLGAELVSLIDKKSGREMIWQGQKDIWDGHCYNIFPFAGRLNEDVYLLHGERYSMPLHGFAFRSRFRLVSSARDSLTFSLSDDIETLQRYPFHFIYTVTYRLAGNKLSVCYRADNRSDRDMYCNFGAHPGILLPSDDGTLFSDYFLEFSKDGVRELLTDEKKLLTGQVRSVPVRLCLGREMFRNGARIYATGGGLVRLANRKNAWSVTFDYRDFDYLVLWTRGNAPLLCVEPWGSVTEKRGRISDLSERADMLSVKSGAWAEKQWSMEVADEQI